MLQYRTSVNDRGWLTAALLLAALIVPTASIVWLMNEAMTSQTTAARQSVLDAYRGQVRSIGHQINTYWEKRASDLDALAARGAPSAFQRAVMEAAADSLVFLDADGEVLYPSVSGSSGAPGAPINSAGRPLHPGAARDIRSREVLAARDAVRTLMRSGRRAEALQAIERRFLSGPVPSAHDEEGRLVNADEHLLALTLMRPSDARWASLVERFARLLNDYDTVLMPASQRLFLMSKLRALAPDVSLPTHEAEGMAADYLEMETPRSDLTGLRPARLPGVWQIASLNGRAIALYREETVHTIQHRLVDEHQSDMVRFTIFPPGEGAYDDAVAVGPALPGWLAAFTVLDTDALDQSVRARVASYVWVGALAIGLFAVAALGAGHRFRRQLHLTRLKTDLVAAVSHELRTPLASMRLLVDGLLQDATLDPVKTREYLNMIAVENGRLSRLIDNFLTFSRLERNRHQFTFSATSPHEVVQAAVEAMRERLHPGCAIDVDIAPGLPLVRADADALVTALLNLLDNAYKYTPDDKRITVRAAGDAKGVLFSVADNGIGIPAAEQKRIFRRFYRVDRRLARETAGVGLGLSIVSEIARAHGGTVQVRSNEGTGSTFTLRVPAWAGAPA